jgi:hypothetical protein
LTATAFCAGDSVLVGVPGERVADTSRISDPIPQTAMAVKNTGDRDAFGRLETIAADWGTGEGCGADSGIPDTCAIGWATSVPSRK